MDGPLKNKLASLLAAPVLWECRLAPFTSFAIGGPAEALARVDHRGELQPLLGFLAEEKIPWRIIGRGSNLLVRDEGFAGVILLLGREFKEISRPEGISSTTGVIAGGGVSLGRLALSCSDFGLAGLEFAAGIPGTVSGGVVMNAGAWGEDMAGVVQALTLIDADGARRLTAAAGELDFAYRSWPGFAAYSGRAVIAEVEFGLRPDSSEAITARSRVLAEKRERSQPRARGSAGSFFKNPPGESAGRLIEACGLKGLKVGGAMVSERHGNFLVNTGQATAGEVLTLMKIVQEKVKNDQGIILEPEVHFL
jgi:UDP-N-acetylmuramate dehydrogenase